MEPSLQTPLSPETGSLNRGPNFTGRQEQYSVAGPEKLSSAEAQPSGQEARDALKAVQFSPPPSPVQDSAAPLTTDDTQLIAADDDLIEKEWITKAKAIVDKTRDDPYQQEDQVSKLQGDYLKKRYGKEMKLSES